MAFLDNPAIILAHIRQSHVTSDDTGMCEMVLIDQDVDLEKCHLALIHGSSNESAMLSSLNEGFGAILDSHTCDLSQSMDITSSWDFGIRRRSNTGLQQDSHEKPKAAAQRLERLRKERQNQIKCKNIQWKERSSSQSVEDLGSFFEKRDYKDRVQSSCMKSTLSLRLEQCPQQLNNPFNEYSKFDGKGHIGTTATKKIDVYLSMQMAQEKVHPMTVVTIANARVHDLIGLICWQYTSEGREPKLNEDVSAYCLHIAEDDGEVDTDFPPLDSNEPIHKFGFSTLALVEKYSSPGLGSRQSLFVRINAAQGFSLIPVDSLKVTMKEILQKALKKRKGSQKGSGPLYRLEKQTDPNVAVDLDSTLESQSTLEFCLVRENSSRGEESSEEDPPIDITAVQDMLSSHHYKSFKISMIHKLRFTTDVQLGISGEKVEIDPVTNQKTSTKFWIRQKPISIDSDHLCACDLVEERSPNHAIFKITYLSNHDYKPLYFESDSTTVSEIVLKVNYILESRASTTRADYFAQKHRKLSRRTSFSFQKDKKSSQ
ncbi:target of rapamycin complex 2 subunit MAPKAP1 isoform X3 [Syngnathoides biaculeatus]|nr:target of rapamycin complex 2 subunit MAPKAP1 isoform X3 [Syngnathoides biaculeatus]XP_061703616.1 target of rapamycin complex 2 subunit MAPKAP1 isoform X3 [Syngnathoides biaculeatus]XP_061703617.1 target of rapamycin complex 2 subunit MAPKAP1 isoform X3 [Syngnathoides biaculeatus]XP_061703618.1 target of rapamycin complex 2 subunit MAPKAP1 isoform X3 [Syngnathoides biaculeatus]XP_061703619.1 target of rapamycin complex 2 subunit MAPKAP1 isoform X3 [Syngnathoides biaculeatus]XP_061703620.1 